MDGEADEMADVLIAVLAEVEKTAPGLTSGQLVMFLHILRREGVQMTELSTLCGRHDAVVSRGVRAMAVAGDAGTLAPAHGLVELLRGADARRRHLALTPAGNALAGRMAALFGMAADGADAGGAEDDRGARAPCSR